MSLGASENQYSNFIELLIKAINEEEVVKSAIRGLFDTGYAKYEKEYRADKDGKELQEMRQSLEELESENTKLHAELERYKNECERITSLNHKLTQDLQNGELKLKNEIEKNSKMSMHASLLSDVNENLQQQIMELKEKNYELEGRFNVESSLFLRYKNLSPSLKNSLSGIFRGNTVEEFIFCGVQRQNIELLWETIKIRAIGENYSELRQLISIFEYFFAAYNKTFETPAYQFLDVSENEKFDNDRHIRTSNSLSSGTVSKVIFRGYVNNNNRKIERKTIVKVE